MNTQTVQLPPQWSTHAASVDWVFYFVYWVSVVLFIGIIGTALYFVVKYRRRPGVKSEPTGHNTALEVGWTIAPVVLLALLFHWGFRGYMDLAVAPANAMDIRVRARKWQWDFEYPNGAHDAGVLHVPVGRPVRLVMSSEDVIHSFYVPAFRVKRDAVPGMYSTLWFEANTTGTTDYFCTEYCGAGAPIANPDGTVAMPGHFSMIGHVIVEPQAQFDQHLREINGPPRDPTTGRPVTAAEWGRQLYRAQNCFTCHSLNGAAGTGPTWQGLYGRHEVFNDGGEVNVDENYIRESILAPQAHIVRGFQPVMPTYRGSLSDQQLDAIIAFIRTLH